MIRIGLLLASIVLGVVLASGVAMAVNPPSGAVRGIEDGAEAVLKIVLEREEGVTAAKIMEWAKTGLEAAVDHGPDAYDAYKEFDRDLDTYRDSKDNCPYVFNPDQNDSDAFGAGDACDDSENADSDSLPDFLDNCPNVWNPSQVNYDRYLLYGDEVGDACDFDMDGDLTWNVFDSDMDGDGYALKYDLHNDPDGVLNAGDNFDWAPAYY
jgi:hypothetical protein